MRKFLYKTLAFYCVAAALVYVVDYLRTHGIINYSVLGAEVCRSVEKSKTKQDVKTVIIGDSCGQQLYSNSLFSDSVYSLTCNRTVTMAGHYFLLHSFITTNSCVPQNVVLICTPFSLRADINSNGYTFQYFLKPFYRKEYKPLMSDYLLHRIKGVSMYWMSQMPYIRCSNILPQRWAEQEESEQLIGQLSEDYLDSIIRLCDKYDISFRFVSPPVKASKNGELEKILEGPFPMKETSVMWDYIGSIEVWPDSMFVDEVHLKKEKIPEDYLHLR